MMSAMAEKTALLPKGNLSDVRPLVVLANCRTGERLAGLGSGEECNAVKFLSKPVV
jgi:hypothetical protein